MKNEMVIVHVADLSEEAMHWYLAKMQGCNPIVSTRYVEDANGIVTGVKHFSASRTVDFQLFHEVEEKHIEFSWNSTDGWTAQSPETRNIQRAEKMAHAAYKVLINDYAGVVVSVPACLQES